jgi:hypothetical protein
MTETRFPNGINGGKNTDLDIWSDSDIALYPQGNIWISQGTKLIFEGTTPDDWEVKLQATTVTADRDIVLPDASGTVAVSVSDTTTTTQGALNLDFTLSATGDISATGSAYGLGSGSSPAFTSPAITTSITTPSTTFDFVNTTATTLNLGGAATDVNIGAATGTTTVNNDLQVDGELTLNNSGNINSTSNYSLTNIVVDDYALAGGGITNLEVLKSVDPTLGNFVNAGDTVTFNADPGYPTTTVLGSVIDNSTYWSIPVSTSWVNGLSVPPTTWNFSGSNTATWTFGSDGNLTLPAGGDIVDSVGTSILDRISVTGSSAVLTKDPYNTTRLTFTGNANIETAGYLSGSGGLALVDSSSQQYVIVKSDRVQINTGFPDQGTGLQSYNEWQFLKSGVFKLPTTGIIENNSKQWRFSQDGRTTFPAATVPAHSYGAAGDVTGMIAFDSTYIYYCTANYVNTSTDIWKRVALDATAW